MATTALHIAVRTRNTGLLHSLLHIQHHNPNSIDHEGRPPLFAACFMVPVCVEIVRLLIEAGADPSFADDEGFNALHLVAYHDHTELVDMLHARAPTALNRRAAKGKTPLWVACSAGSDRVVSKLLSLGAMEHGDGEDDGPLATAVERGFTRLVRVLIHERGIRAVGGECVVPNALRKALAYRRPNIFRLLLTVGGQDRRAGWANIMIQGKSLVHCAAAFCFPAAVSVLLEAGAEEMVQDALGRTARDDIGACRCQVSPGEEVAVRRILDRGPAYRARSWAWPVDDKADAERSAGGDRHGDVALAFSATSSPSAMMPTTVAGLRVFRPTTNDRSGNSFAKLIGRYSAKD